MFTVIIIKQFVCLATKRIKFGIIFNMIFSNIPYY